MWVLSTRKRASSPVLLCRTNNHSRGFACADPAFPFARQQRVFPRAGTKPSCRTGAQVQSYSFLFSLSPFLKSRFRAFESLCDFSLGADDVCFRSTCICQL